MKKTIIQWHKKKHKKNDKRTINAVQNTTEKTEQHEFC
jgi:hypothetical protein